MDTSHLRTKGAAGPPTRTRSQSGSCGHEFVVAHDVLGPDGDLQSIAPPACSSLLSRLMVERFREQLQREFDERRAKNACFSLRAFATLLGAEHAAVSQILRGK